jgi:hypothetical protein
MSETPRLAEVHHGGAVDDPHAVVAALLSRLETQPTCSPVAAARQLEQSLANVSHIPSALRYAIARAQGAVEAPPFDSTAEFVKVLRRFEQGSSSSVVERRRAPLVVELRRELRAADRQAYEYHIVARSSVPPRLQTTVPPPPPGRTRRVVPAAVAAGLAAALAGFALSDPVRVQPAPPAPGLALAAPASTPDAPPSISANDRRFALAEAARSVDAPRRIAVKQKQNGVRARKPSRLRSFLRFEWARHLITIHNDL